MLAKGGVGAMRRGRDRGTLECGGKGGEKERGKKEKRINIRVR